MSSKTRTYFSNRFHKIIEQLNPAQRIAVTKINDPMLVVAGPGTGKTHILAARIGQILQETDTQSHNILCLTFTDAGVLAMRDRLRSFIGAEAHKIHIYTFHSFCNMIIQEHLETFGHYDMEPVSELERVEIIRDILEDAPEENPLKRGRWDLFYYEGHLKKLFQQMKEEHWTPEYIEEQIDAYIASFSDREEFLYQRTNKHGKKGELKMSKVLPIQERMERLRAAIYLFPEYELRMKAANRYDFADMILWIIEAFQTHPYLLRRYQEQYHYFLIDEFQDTNGSQSEVLEHLIEYWEQPNVFVVGDDDQAIYEFQGARLRNIMDFQEKHQPEIVMMEENYRSSQAILDAANVLIQHNKERIVRQIPNLSKELTASNPKIAKATQKPHIIEYPNPMHEDTAIVNKIQELQQTGVPLQEMAVIYAKHSQVRNIITLLEKRNIAYNAKRRVNILDLALIRNIRTILSYIHAEHQRPDNGEEYLFHMMHFSFLGIETLDVRAITHYMAKHRNLRWRTVLSDADTLAQLGLKNPTAILRFSELIEGLLQDMVNIRLLTFIERLINKSGVLAFVLQHEEKTWWLQVLQTFTDFIRQETDRNPRLSVQRLLSIFQNMDESNLQIGINKTIFAKNGVNLVTAHSSKGLEFQVVFMIGAGKDWEGGSSNRNYFTLPDTLIGSSTSENEEEARRRLFYVAMTRAKEQLYISFCLKNNEGKPLKRASFVDEILEHETLGLKVQNLSLPPAELEEIHELLQTETTSPQIAAQDQQLVDDLLDGFVLSVSAMNRYQACPLSFYYDYVLRIPSIPNEAATYGTAMHNALKRLYDKMAENEDHRVFPPREDLVSYFEYEMRRRRHYFSKKGYTRRLNMGIRHLKDYYTAYAQTWSTNAVPEMDIKNVNYLNVPIKGTLDLVIFEQEHEAVILDYKTGSHKKEKLKAPSPAKTNLNGGIYWRQLYFYKILYDNYYASTRNVKSGIISYLDTDNEGNYPTVTLNYESKHQQLVGEMIVATYQSIMEHDFYEGCGEPTCKWCNFVKKNIPVDSFADEDAEDLDD